MTHEIESIRIESERAIKSILQHKTNQMARFSVGDFIYGVTGVILVEKISYRTVRNHLNVKYIGRNCRWLKGGFITYTKKSKSKSIIDYGNLKKIEPHLFVHPE